MNKKLKITVFIQNINFVTIYTTGQKFEVNIFFFLLKLFILNYFYSAKM